MHLCHFHVPVSHSHDPCSLWQSRMYHVTVTNVHVTVTNVPCDSHECTMWQSRMYHVTVMNVPCDSHECTMHYINTWVYSYVLAYICIHASYMHHTCIHTCMHASARIHTVNYFNTCLRVCNPSILSPVMCVCVCVCLWTCVFIGTWAYVCLWVCMCTYECVRVLMSVYVGRLLNMYVCVKYVCIHEAIYVQAENHHRWHILLEVW